jgi:glycerol-3-phosphate dehydrogenase
MGGQLAHADLSRLEPHGKTGKSTPNNEYDVVVLGAGVVGCALAFELSQLQLRVALVEARSDVGEGTSKANSAIIATGFDESPGTLESRLVAAASHRWPAMAAKLQIPYRRVGLLVLAFTQEQVGELEGLRLRAEANGVADTYVVLGQRRLKQLEPHISDEVLGALCVPREAVVDPFTTVVLMHRICRLLI